MLLQSSSVQCQSTYCRVWHLQEGETGLCYWCARNWGLHCRDSLFVSSVIVFFFLLYWTKVSAGRNRSGLQWEPYIFKIFFFGHMLLNGFKCSAPFSISIALTVSHWWSNSPSTVFDCNLKLPCHTLLCSISHHFCSKYCEKRCLYLYFVYKIIAMYIASLKRIWLITLLKIVSINSCTVCKISKIVRIHPQMICYWIKFPFSWIDCCRILRLH